MRRWIVGTAATIVAILITGLPTPSLRAADPPVAMTTTGAVSGSSGDVVAFKGIPFARPPVGDRRWQAPVPAEPWSAVRPATEFSPACIQQGDLRTSEDCLAVNVWTPASAFGAGPGGRKLPVMVWVFGGSFTGGSGDIDGSVMARKGVVVVSFNYRLSTFGFLAHPQLSAESPHQTSGNYGLLDAMAAFRWVQQNIAAFGGDPARVTAWGWSAGGSLITAMLVSPHAKGLFQQAILESAGAMHHWKTLVQAEREGQNLGANIRALRQLPAAQVPFIQQLGGARGVRALFEPRLIGPILDGHFLTREERETFEAGEMHRIPLIVGTNTDEGGTYTAAYPVATIDAYRDYLRRPQVFGSFAAEAARLYPAATDAVVARTVSNSFGDSQFNFGARGVARAMAATGAPVYRYRFARKSDGGRGHDPWHEGEVPYLMGTVGNAPYNRDDRVLSDTMIDAWARFATTGNPGGGSIGTWPAYDATTDPTLVLGVPLSIERGFHNAQLDFIGTVQRATRK